MLSAIVLSSGLAAVRTALASGGFAAETMVSTPTPNGGGEDEPEEALALEDGGGTGGDGDLSFVREAEGFFRQAARLYENGELAEAQERYRRALHTLTANLCVGLHYRLREEYSRLLCGIRRLAAGGGGAGIPIDEDNELVARYIEEYTAGDERPFMRRALERCGRYRDMVLSVLREYDLPEELVYLPVVESFYNINNRSSAGALGLWQLMPERARALGLRIDCWVDERKHPEKSTRAAARYLKQLYGMFGDWHLALAAYNRGEYGLLRDMRGSQSASLEEASRRKAVPAETERFVPRFMACVLIGSDPEKYGLRITPEEPLRYDAVPLERSVDLKVAADCARTTIGELRALNPGLKAWCTPYGYPGFELRLPPGARQVFLKRLAAVRDPNPVTGYVKYTVVKGENLDHIARRFGTTAGAIRKDNRLRLYQRVRENQTLIIRPGRERPLPGGEKGGKEKDFF